MLESVIPNIRVGNKLTIKELRVTASVTKPTPTINYNSIPSMSSDRDHATKIPNSPDPGELLGTARTTKYQNNHPANDDSLNNQQISLFVPPPFSTLPQAEADRAINQIREMIVPKFSNLKSKRRS